MFGISEMEHIRNDLEVKMINYDIKNLRRNLWMFTCDKCGLCCMHIDESSLDEGMNRGDGVCKFFNDNTYLCKI